MQEPCQQGGVMDKRLLLLGLVLFAGCAEKDPDEEARQDLEKMATKSKKETKYRYIVKGD
jgi:hypothetical protein